MTTTVTVKAHHGWPVDVSSRDPKTGKVAQIHRVPENTEYTFYATNTTDLLIHEVQPAEIEAEGAAVA